MKRKIGFILFSLIILVMNWENQKSVAALFTESPIPEQSIRLRIIANSDAPQDQILKREIRDNINAYLADKVQSLDTMDEAREKMKQELPHLEEIVTQTIEKSGFDYNSNVELGTVPFPTKMYGTYVYPAGEYEALRVTVGAGLGQNWWCVLFPPLCFVDISTGDAVKATATEEPKKDKDSDADKDSNTVELAAGEKAPPKIEVKFFLVELFEKIFAAIFG